MSDTDLLLAIPSISMDAQSFSGQSLICVSHSLLGCDTFVWRSHSQGGWYRARRANGEEITLRIQISDGSSIVNPKPKGTINIENYEVCLKVCWPEEPKCPEGWNAKKFGDGDYPCWTCCKKTGDDDL
ncbi:hypothetical protein QX201_010189 [Fusarium graminearum]